MPVRIPAWQAGTPAQRCFVSWISESSNATISLPLLLAAPAWSAGAFFNILDYGAHNDASAPATEAIRSAIQAATAAGGGTVFIPAGNYVSGPIELVSNLTLHVDAGATVRFPAARLPFTEGRQQSIEALTPVPLIGGRHLENVAITAAACWPATMRSG